MVKNGKSKYTFHGQEWILHDSSGYQWWSFTFQFGLGNPVVLGCKACTIHILECWMLTFLWWLLLNRCPHSGSLLLSFTEGFHKLRSMIAGNLIEQASHLQWFGGIKTVIVWYSVQTIILVHMIGFRVSLCEYYVWSPTRVLWQAEGCWQLILSLHYVCCNNSYSECPIDRWIQQQLQEATDRKQQAIIKKRQRYEREQCNGICHTVFQLHPLSIPNTYWISQKEKSCAFACFLSLLFAINHPRFHHYQPILIMSHRKW